MSKYDELIAVGTAYSILFKKFPGILFYDVVTGNYDLVTDIKAIIIIDLFEMADEFFFNVYYRYYTENGITASHLYDPDILGWIGLPHNASCDDIKKRFRELAKKYHPDMG